MSTNYHVRDDEGILMMRRQEEDFWLTNDDIVPDLLSSGRQSLPILSMTHRDGLASSLNQANCITFVYYIFILSESHMREGFKK